MKQTSKDCSFPPGLHSATVTRCTLAKDSSGKPMVNRQTGEATIRVEFQGANGMTGSQLIEFSEHTEWITNNLKKACKLDPSKVINVKELLGVRLWIYVKGIYRIGSQPGIDEPLHTEIIVGKYSQFLGPRPALVDDPQLNGGIPRGMFVEWADIGKPEDAVNLEERSFDDD